MANLDFSADFRVFDNTEAGSYLSRTGESTFAAPIAITAALREEEAKQETGPGGSLLAKTTTAWHISQTELGAAVPKVGDQFTDSLGVAYIVLPGISYSRQMTQMWRLPVQQAV